MILLKKFYVLSVLVELSHVIAGPPTEMGSAVLARRQVTQRAVDQCPSDDDLLLCSECGGPKPNGKCAGSPPNSSAKDCDCIDDSVGDPDPYIPYGPGDLEKIASDWEGLPDLGGEEATTGNSAPDDLKCRGVSGKLWINSRDKAVDWAETFCGQAQNSQDYIDKKRKRGQPHLNDARLTLTNKDPAKAMKDAPDCLGHFTRIIDSCDGNDPINNPHNYKFGGTITTSDGWEYEVEPLAHKENGVTCDISYKGAFHGFEIRGKNWPDAKLGADGEGLRAQVSGCGGLTKWKFEWTPDDCCYQWFASGQTLIGNKKCIGRAVKSAGGADVDDCAGLG